MMQPGRMDTGLFITQVKSLAGAHTTISRQTEGLHRLIRVSTPAQYWAGACTNILQTCCHPGIESHPNVEDVDEAAT